MAELITVLAAPFYLLLIGLELWIDKKRGTGFYRFNDAICSMSLGVISRTHRLILFAFGVYVFSEWLPKSTAVDWQQHTLLAWLIAFVGYDLIYYWSHRFGHEINILWAGHVVHHQSEDYNLSTALRQTSGGFFDWIFAFPLYLLGLPAEIIVASAGFNLLYQFWVHTQHIDRLGWMEKWMVTPSHHRVHHAQNTLYWDKNYGGVFIIWDKIFNTFQEERSDTPIVYGVSRPLNTLNPLKANLQVWWYLLRDAIYCKSWWDAVRIWFMPTGWRPADMEASLPIVKSNMQDFHKYHPQVSNKRKAYALFQFVAGLVMGFFFIFHFADMSLSTKLFAWGFVTLPLITTGMLLDGEKPTLEWLRLVASALALVLMWPQLSSISFALFGGFSLASLLLAPWLLPAAREPSAV